MSAGGTAPGVAAPVGRGAAGDASVAGAGTAGDGKVARAAGLVRPGTPGGAR